MNTDNSKPIKKEDGVVTKDEYIDNHQQEPNHIEQLNVKVIRIRMDLNDPYHWDDNDR